MSIAENFKELAKELAQEPKTLDDFSHAQLHLGLAMVEATFSHELLERLSGACGIGAIVVAPSYEHVAMIVDALEHLLPETCSIHTVLGADKSIMPNRLLDGLRSGFPVVAVTDDVEAVPLSFRAIASETVVLRTHGPVEVTKALEAVIGRGEPDLPSGFCAHPNPLIVASCISSRLPRKTIVEGLVRLGRIGRAEPDEDLPSLEECVEFGTARDWGLAVVRDVRLYASGKLPASDLDTAAILVSPPGYGKTYFAKVLAQALNAPLHHITTGSLFVNDGHLGNVLQALRKQFAAAKAAAPAVLLIDELDSFSRRDVNDANRSFVTAVINELLALTDGASGKAPGLVLLGATNLPNLVDPALRRPGRMSRTLTLTPPDAAGVEHVLRTHLRHDLVDVALTDLVSMAAGATPARLMEAVGEARGLARMADRPLTLADLEQVMGHNEERPASFLHRIAVHEAGHALMTLLVPGAPRLRSVSIVPDVTTMGNVGLTLNDGAVTLKVVEAEIMVHLGGRAAENLVFGDDPGDGAGSDLRTATLLAARARGALGMKGTLLHYRDVERRLVSDRQFADSVEADLQRLLSAATEIIRPRLPEMGELVVALLRRRSLDGAEAAKILLGAEGTVPNCTAAAGGRP